MSLKQLPKPGHYAGGRPKSQDGDMAAYIGVPRKFVQRMGGADRLLRMTSDARAVLCASRPTAIEMLEVYCAKRKQEAA